MTTQSVFATPIFKRIAVFSAVISLLSLYLVNCGSGNNPAAPVVAPANLTYATDPASYAMGTVIAPNMPTSTGGAVASYSVTPALPAGLTLNTVTGAISGTPAAVTALAQYTVTATNSAGSTTVSLGITITVAPPSGLSYSRSQEFFTVTIPVDTAVPTVGGGAPTAYSISPALPAGLTFSTTTGEIFGIPSVGTPSAVYTVTATNEGGSATTSISIDVDKSMSLVAPVGGERYSFTDTIVVRWTTNADSLGTQPLPSFTRQFSLDSGKNWVNMTASPASWISNNDGVYQETWTGLDTSLVNPVTFQPLTKEDFLNKGVIVHIISYPPKLVTRQSGYIFFHD